MARRRFEDDEDYLPSGAGWVFVGLFLVFWAGFSLFYWLSWMGDVRQLLDSFSAMGIYPDEASIWSALRPLLWLFPLLGFAGALPVVLAMRRWVNRQLAKALR